MQQNNYPIGTPGTPWGESEKAAWRALQSVKRSYHRDVVEALDELDQDFERHHYGTLDYETPGYPLYGLTNRDWHPDKPVVLITGGVHGYETSGVHGALRFAASRARDYLFQINLVVLPCISPWGYETINRWNPFAIDPNRSFFPGSPAGEASLAMAWVSSQSDAYLAHFDLHETTDTDNSEFRPAKGARDGNVEEEWEIPDGFYLVGDSGEPASEFQRAIIKSVEKVTHIAPPDPAGRLIGIPMDQPGVIGLDLGSLHLCAGMTRAPYRTTTEVYPDSPRVDDENCILAQVAAVSGGLDFILGR